MRSRMANIEVQWERGGTGWLVESDGHRVLVHSDTAAAPGTPLTGTRLGHDGELIQVKVRGCRRIAEAPIRYAIDGRFMNLSATLRQALLSELGE